MLLHIALLATASIVSADLPPANEVKPVEIVKTGDDSEGVVVDHDGNLYFSHGTFITKVHADGGKSSSWCWSISMGEVDPSPWATASSTEHSLRKVNGHRSFGASWGRFESSRIFQTSELF